MAWVSSFNGLEDCVCRGLDRAHEHEDWATFEAYLLVAFRRPSRSYTTVLCEVLGRQSGEVNNEDIVDVSAEIRDPSAVDALEQALCWQPSWDEFSNLAVKAVWALAAIGTPEAMAALEDAAACSSAEIREAAARELQRHKHRG